MISKYKNKRNKKSLSKLLTEKYSHVIVKYRFGVRWNRSVLSLPVHMRTETVCMKDRENSMSHPRTFETIMIHYALYRWMCGCMWVHRGSSDVFLDSFLILTHLYRTIEMLHMAGRHTRRKSEQLIWLLQWNSINDYCVCVRKCVTERMNVCICICVNGRRHSRRIAHFLHIHACIHILLVCFLYTYTHIIHYADIAASSSSPPPSCIHIENWKMSK